MTPKHKWIGKPCDLPNLRVFGYIAYAHRNDGMLESRLIKGIVLRYPLGVKGYRIFLTMKRDSKQLIAGM